MGERNASLLSGGGIFGHVNDKKRQVSHPGNSSAAVNTEKHLFDPALEVTARAAWDSPRTTIVGDNRSTRRALCVLQDSTHPNVPSVHRQLLTTGDITVDAWRTSAVVSHARLLAKKNTTFVWLLVKLAIHPSVRPAQ